MRAKLSPARRKLVLKGKNGMFLRVRVKNVQNIGVLKDKNGMLQLVHVKFSPARRKRVLKAKSGML